MDIPWLLILYISLGGGALIWLLITWLNRRDNKRFGKIADKWNLGRFKQGRATFRTKNAARAAKRAGLVIAALASTLPSCDSLTATERALLDDAASRAIDRVLPKPVRAQK